jgi:hypothetical protein
VGIGVGGIGVGVAVGTAAYVTVLIMGAIVGDGAAQDVMNNRRMRIL